MIKKVTKTSTIAIMQLLATMVLLVVIYQLNMIPFKFLIVIIAILILFFIFMFRKMKKNEKRKRNIFYKLISVLVSVCMLIGSVYILQGSNLLSSITGGTTQVQTVSVIVLNDSGYEELTDIDGLSLGVNLNTDEANISQALSSLEEEISVSQVESSGFADMAESLYNGEVDAIIMNEVYRTTMENTYTNFDSETTVIWTYEIEEEIEDIAKEADVTNETFSIYISGIDTYGSVGTVSRSDVNLILTVNPTTKEILMTSIPRDMYVDVSYSTSLKDKLTHAGNYGINTSVETIENFLDIDINYYLKVNFTSLIDIVDALGGVNVYSQYSFTTLTGGYYISSGYNQLEGYEALCFVRERYSLPNGDYDRGINQTELLKAMIEKVISPTIITNYTSILNSIDGSFVTNMSESEIQSLIKMQISDMASWTFQTVQVEGTGGAYAYTASYPSQKLSVQYPVDSSVQEVSDYINAMMTGESITVE
ncbi:LCP family protein [Tannockella kyphosi]|uniref:LCP family protein n=1 Tax=Tannockella kyphosi TaxID=2899121 RepID=UPI002010DE42|nr:LCP family protein [Tannockella kyphosi]